VTVRVVLHRHYGAERIEEKMRIHRGLQMLQLVSIGCRPRLEFSKEGCIMVVDQTERHVAKGPAKQGCHVEHEERCQRPEAAQRQ
jgi:hypothetical protein